MIKVHCLAYSRAIRLLWLLEDLGQPYELVQYDRTDAFRAPEPFRKVHPLGKSPVMEDGDIIVSESVTCLRYLTEKFGDGTHRPKGNAAGNPGTCLMGTLVARGHDAVALVRGL